MIEESFTEDEIVVLRKRSELDKIGVPCHKSSMPLPIAIAVLSLLKRKVIHCIDVFHLQPELGILVDVYQVTDEFKEAAQLVGRNQDS